MPNIQDQLQQLVDGCQQVYRPIVAMIESLSNITQLAQNRQRGYFFKISLSQVKVHFQPTLISSHEELFISSFSQQWTVVWSAFYLMCHDLLIISSTHSGKRNEKRSSQNIANSFPYHFPSKSETKSQQIFENYPSNHNFHQNQTYQKHTINPLAQLFHNITLIHLPNKKWLHISHPNKHYRQPAASLIQKVAWRPIDVISKKQNIINGLSDESKPNSKYLAVLAQVGCFVPAREYVGPVCDQIFCRMGSCDRIHEGKQIFYVQLEETNRIFSKATRRSLVVIDELGRGTSTYDGMPIPVQFQSL